MTTPFLDPEFWPPMPTIEPVAARPVKLMAPEFCIDDCASWVGEDCDCLNSPQNQRRLEDLADWGAR
jgi:hypothetical protein